MSDDPSLMFTTGPHAGTTLALDAAKPLRLPIRREGEQVGQVVVEYQDDSWVLVNHSPVHVVVSGHQVNRAVLHDADRVEIGPLVFVVSLPLSPSPRGAARSSKRISASRDAMIEEEPDQERKRLLKKVGSVFKRKDERIDRLERLRAERAELLRDAGLEALTAHGGLGLPDQVLQDLVVGRSVTINPDQLDQRQLEQFRERSRQLGLLDTTIGALCAELDVPVDLAAGERQMRLATEAREIEEEAHRAMDAVMTENLDELMGDLDDSASATAPTAAVDTEAANSDDTEAYLASVDPSNRRQSADRRTTADRRASDDDHARPRAKVRSGRRRRR